MAWHKQYGKVVRLGPNRISVADKDMVQQVLMTDDFPKGPSYNRLQSKKPDHSRRPITYHMAIRIGRCQYVEHNR